MSDEFQTIFVMF